MMGRMPKLDDALREIVEEIDVARNMVLDFEVRFSGAESLEGYEAMRVGCDRVLRSAALKVMKLAEAV